MGNPIHDRAGAVMYQSENDSRSSLPEYAPKHGCSGVLDGVIGVQLVYRLDRLRGIQIMDKIRLVVKVPGREDGDGSSSLDHRLSVWMGNWRSLQ